MSRKPAYPWRKIPSTTKGSYAFMRCRDREGYLIVARVDEIHNRGECFWTASVIDANSVTHNISPDQKNEPGFPSKRAAINACDASLKEHGYLPLAQRLEIMI